MFISVVNIWLVSTLSLKHSSVHDALSSDLLNVVLYGCLGSTSGCVVLLGDRV